MKADVFSEILNRAKSRKDGVYTYKGIYFAVKDKRAIAAGHFGEIYQICFGMLVAIGAVKSYETKTALNKLLKDGNFS